MGKRGAVFHVKKSKLQRNQLQQMMRFLYRLVFLKILGWKIDGAPPADLKKYIIVVAPHSSNWDFLIGLATRSILSFPSNYLAKSELFRPPYGWIFRKLGGYPVDRTRSEHLVDQVIAICNREERFVIAIAPEGTRGNVDKWKTGFYHIAKGAGIPMVLVGLDYDKRIVKWSGPLIPSGDLEKDAKTIDTFFEGMRGKSRIAAKVLGNPS